MMFLNKHSIALALVLVASLNNAAGNENPPDAGKVWPAARKLKKASEKELKKASEKELKKSSEKELKKLKKASEKELKKASEKEGKKGPKDAKKKSKSAKSESSVRNLQQDIQDTLKIRDLLREAYNYDPGAREECVENTNPHRNCIYDIFSIGGNFECECRPVDGAEIFEAVDINNDDHITLEEILTYFQSDPCEPSFIYNGLSFEGCTDYGDTYGFEWCSTKTLKDGTHAIGFFKYCHDDDNKSAWEGALDSYDANGDRMLSFKEAVLSKKERRRRLQLNDIINGGRGNCNDCNEVQRQLCLSNPIIATIDGECRNYIKTIPFDDSNEDEENLLHMLGVTMVDVYDSCKGFEDGQVSNGSVNYWGCPTLRGGMDQWIDRTYLSEYPEQDGWVLVASCAAIAGEQEYGFVTGAVKTAATAYVGPVVAGAGALLMSRFLTAASVALECQRVFAEVTDGRDALQWATYTIRQGPYQGKTILSFMGTDPSNAEQLVADLWSVPLANGMMRNMTDDAVQIAQQVIEEVGGKENLFITGHSLGGIVAELTCSELGIQGASFGAIGAFDPYSLADAAIVDSIMDQIESNGDAEIDAINGYIDDIRTMFNSLGYSEEDINFEIQNISVETLRRSLISLEYNGLIQNTAHAGVKFEVVKNENDYQARAIGSLDGSQCSHIASSCEVRKLWFEASASTNMGHSSSTYAQTTNAKFSRGWQPEAEAIVRWDKLFLPGVHKNALCDICLDGRDEWCDSGSCSDGQCKVGDKLPTFCPARSLWPEQRSACPNGNDDCISDRCESGFIQSTATISRPGQVCYDKLAPGVICNENSDCISGSCSWWYYCD